MFHENNLLTKSGMKKCWIFDDLYWEKIYQEVSGIYPELDYPITKNITNPLPYLTQIEDWDIILLDNYFPSWSWEAPLGDDFLKWYLEMNKNAPIISISNCSTTSLLQRFEYREQAAISWKIKWRIRSKDGFEIAFILKEYHLI